ncbi:hypothetical protein K1719_020274 [Acacia pycnantha]|nr:hypothetical protein K1719_020274 [Acacia pycnantha]
MNKNGYRYEKSCCYFHPKHEVVGVCPLCLNQRLLVLAAKQGLNPSTSTSKLQTLAYRKTQASSIHKIFAFGSLFSRPDSQHWKSQTYSYDDSSPSPEGNNTLSYRSKEVEEVWLLSAYFVGAPLPSNF